MAFLDLSSRRAEQALPALPRPAGLLQTARAMAALRRQRAALARLDDARLADLGLSRAEAQAEAARPFWDVPATWRG